MCIRVFQKFHFVKKKYCNTSTHPSGVYINQIQKNFFPKSSLEGQTSWSKMVKTPVSVSPSFSLPASSSSPLLDLFLVLFAPVSLFPATSFLRLAILEKTPPGFSQSLPRPHWSLATRSLDWVNLLHFLRALQQVLLHPQHVLFKLIALKHTQY